jgi:hypothetical protein
MWAALIRDIESAQHRLAQDGRAVFGRRHLREQCAASGGDVKRNQLLRQHFPKGTDLSVFGQD